MEPAQFSLDINQFNRLFPYYLLINENLVVDGSGKRMEELCGACSGKPLLECYSITGEENQPVDFQALKTIAGQNINLQFNNSSGIIFNGTFEYLETTNQLLFTGTPKINAHDAEEELMRLSLVATANENGVLFNDASGKILWVNESFSKMTGYAFEEIIGKSPLDFCIGPLTDIAIIQEIGRSIGQKDIFSEELIHYRKDRSWFWGRVKGQAFKTPQNNEKHYFAVIEDVTAEKESEEQLRILAKIAEDNINAVIITDKQGHTTWVNKGFTKVTGYTLAEALNTTPGGLLQGPETDQKAIAYLRKQIDKGEPFNTEILNYSKNGNACWLRIQGQPILNHNGELTGFFAVQEDITHERGVQQLIKESESQFRLALEKIGDNVWEHDYRTGRTLFSKTKNEFWGYPVNDDTNVEKLWWDNVYPEDLQILKDNHLRYQNQKIDFHNLEYRIIHNDGKIKWVLDRGVVIEKDEAGNPLRIIGTHTDISKIKQTERQLEQRVKQFKSLSENIPGIIYEYEFAEDGTERLRYISPAIERIFGIKPDDFNNYLAYIHPDDRDRIVQKNQHSKNTLQPFYDESRLVVPDKGTLWHAVYSSFSYISHKGPNVFTGFMMDITERKNIEQTLRSNEQKYRGIIENMNLGLLEVDNEEIITYANQSFCTMSGYTIAELEGKKASTYFASGESSRVLQEKSRNRENGISDAYEIEVTDKNGDKKWWFISGAPRYNDKDELVGSIGIHLDITAQKRLEHDLIEAKTRAEHLAKTKEIFLANMSHEIRTPMNAIMGMSNQLAKTNLLPQQQFYLEVILSASDNLLVIINDILDLSKMEAGKLSFEDIGFEPKTVAKRVIQVLAHKAEEKGLKLANSYFDKNISPVLIGDPYRLNQVLLNLIGNSIKFTETGTVNLSFKLLKDSKSSQLIEITVSDTGIGMDEEFVEHLFDKFSQANESISRKYGGTGLGMSICRDLVELMGGQIKAESKKGAGTKVWFDIELKKGSHADLPEKDAVNVEQNFLAGKSVLITDDNALNRLIASIILQNHGAKIMEAVNGELAVEAVKNNAVDIVLMDIQMPVMNGIEATKLIRESGNNVPIIALTAEALKGEREKCIALGMDDYITKPFKEDEFLKIIDRLLRTGEESKEEEQTVAEEVSLEALYDLTNLKNISRGNDLFVKKMVNMFCDQTPVLVYEMIAAYDANDLEQMSAVAHKLKPTLDNLNISSLKQVIRNIELASKDNLKIYNLPDLLKSAERTLKQVVNQMKQEYPV